MQKGEGCLRNVFCCVGAKENHRPGPDVTEVMGCRLCPTCPAGWGGPCQQEGGFLPVGGPPCCSSLLFQVAGGSRGTVF